MKETEEVEPKKAKLTCNEPPTKVPFKPDKGTTHTSVIKFPDLLMTSQSVQILSMLSQFSAHAWHIEGCRLGLGELNSDQRDPALLYEFFVAVKQWSGSLFSGGAGNAV